MTQLTMPSGEIIDFGDLTEDQIVESLNVMKDSNPELFVETPVVEQEEVVREQIMPFDISTAPELYRRDYGEIPGDTYSFDQKEKLQSEITDKSFRFNLGRMDTEEEKFNYIQDVMGSQNAVSQDASGAYIIDQALVSPEAREEFNLSESGKIYADKPGFTWYDLVDFGGEAGPALGGAIAASMYVAGAPITFSLSGLGVLATVGLGAGLSKGVDEAIEQFEGYNKQSLGEVGSAIATEAAIAMAGEGAGRAITKAFGRLFKGKGPQASESRIQELESRGLTRAEAEKAAYEEARQEINKIISEGGVPSIQEATDKNLLGTAQSLVELIVPNRKVAQNNVAFVKKTLDDLSKGKISKGEARDKMTEQAESISRMIQSQFTNPKTAEKYTRDNILKILEKEMDFINNQYSPITGFPSEFEEAAKLATNLYTQSTRKLYDDATAKIGSKGDIPTKTINENGETVNGEILQAISDAENANIFLKNPEGSELFKTIRQIGESKGDKFTFADLHQMKQALRIARGDSDLVGTAQQQYIDNVIRAIDDTRSAKHASLVQGLNPDSGLSTTARNELVDGLNQLTEANRIWAEGQEIFNKGVVNGIIKDAKNGKYVATQAVLDNIVKQNNPKIIAQYLDAVTPPKTVKELNLTSDSVAALEEARNIVSVIDPETNIRMPKMDVTVEDLAQVNKILKDSNLSKVNRKEGFIPEVKEFIGNLKPNNNYKTIELRGFVDELDSTINFARAGVGPQALRENVRESLAKKWIEDTIQSSPGRFGRKDPKAFANQYFKLKPEVRKELFGADNVAELDAVIDDFWLIESRTTEDLLSDLPMLRSESLKKQILDLDKKVTEAADLSSTALNKAITDGAILEPSEIVTALLKDPKSYTRLVESVDQSAIKGVGGVEDMVMVNLLDEPFKQLKQGEGIAEDFVQSGKWGSSLKKAIEKQNANGALDQILGKKVVQDLKKLADDAVRVSNAPMESTSIAGRERKLAAAMAITGAVLNPAAAMAAAVPIAGSIFAGRILRNKSFLKMVTSPRLRDAEYQKFIQAGAKVDKDIARKQMSTFKGERHIPGSLIYFINQSLDRVVQPIASQLSASGIVVEPIKEEFDRSERMLLEAEAPRVQSSSNELQLPNTDPQASMLQAPRTTTPGMTASEVFRNQELQKLLGGMPT